ncbi:hypothetical protein IAU60_006555 [Kwoniella sp. DSM 27419]
MPSLSDALDDLQRHSEQLAYLSTLNSSPAGPFVQAHLHLHYHGAGSVLHLIRDANDSERRLYKFVGEGQGGGNKRVEKREGGVVTPLKDLKKRPGNVTSGTGPGQRDETEIMLRTALKLVDDYRPMPRARAHIANLLDTHHSSVDRLAELERLIAEVNQSIANTSPQPESVPEPTPAPAAEQPADVDAPKLTPEEAIKAEEAALRALEASLIPLRKAGRTSEPDPSFNSPPRGSNRMASSPAQRTPFGRGQDQSQQTPFRAESMHARTPAREMPAITNSLVTATPRRVDRFSPLKLIGTPRAPIGSSGLRNEAGGPIFGRRVPSGQARASVLQSSTSGRIAETPGVGNRLFDVETTTPGATGGSSSLSNEATPGQTYLDQADDRDETVRITQTRPASPPALAPPIDVSYDRPITPPATEDDADQSIMATPKGTGASHAASGLIEGVDVESAGVEAVVTKMWSTVGEMMKQGLKDGQEVQPTAPSTVRHLVHLSKSDLPAPPSPSSSSSVSALSAPGAIPAKPITSETILYAHLFLQILHTYSEQDAGEDQGAIDVNLLKSSLEAIAKARGFDGAAALVNKVIYGAMGKRLVKIDRGPGGGKVRFTV